ncbi:hypothetical protein KP509_19G009800 [Ceratopteris richardii]|nr:hypothetical protein KP509_19G009800 [Ceratopteris richardii]
MSAHTAPPSPAVASTAPTSPASNHTVPPSPASNRTVPPSPASNRTVPLSPASNRTVPPSPASTAVSKETDKKDEESTDKQDVERSDNKDVEKSDKKDDEAANADKEEVKTEEKEKSANDKEAGQVEAPIPAEASTPAKAPSIAEIVSEPVEASPVQPPTEEDAATITDEISIHKNQKTNQVAPETTSRFADAATTVVVVESRTHNQLRDLPFALLFVIHLLLAAAGILYLNVVYLHDMSETKLHNLQRWFPQLGVAVVTGGAFAYLCQGLFRKYPNFMARSIIWISPFLTLVSASMLMSTEVAASLSIGVVILIFFICQILYSCLVLRRLKYAADLLSFSINTAKEVHGTYMISFWVLVMAFVWLMFWSFGVVSALTFQLAPLVVLALIVSLAWTMETLQNVVCAATARGVATYYTVGTDQTHWDRSLLSAFTSWFGSICFGSLTVPVLRMLRAMARGLNRVHSDNEFMFSCADCFDKATSTSTKYANNWAYVQVAVHGKAFVHASRDTFSLFRQRHLDVVIKNDLANSFFVFTGISGGMLCVIVCGGWTFGTHKALTASISVVSFLIGYFMACIMMAVPQGAVYAHYVCYGENPSCQGLSASPIPKRLKELLADVDTELTKVS